MRQRDKRGTAVRDMTKGSPVRLILDFAVPMLLGLLFQQLYNMVDAMIVGKWLGVTALAAVGSTGSLNFMIIGFCIGVCTGFSIPVAQKFGAGDYHRLRRFAANSVWASAVLAVVMAAAVCYFCMDILKWMKTPDSLLKDAYAYIFIIFLGIPATYLYNLLSGIIRALGDSKTPVYFLAFSALLNILLDIVSIVCLGMGTAGPAAATVVSQAVSGLLCLLYIKKRYPILRISREEWKADGSCIRKLLFVGVPMGLQYSVTAIGNVVLQAAVNGLGSASIVAVTAGSKVSLFFCCPFDALGGTMATYAGQNIGAGKTERVGKGLKAATVIGAAYAAAAFVFLYFFGRDMTLLFMDAKEQEILELAWQFLTVNALFFVFLVLVNNVRFCIQGMGYSVFAVLAGVCEMAARSLAAFGLVPAFGFAAVCFASPLAWIMADLFLIPAYFCCIRRIRRDRERPAEPAAGEQGH